MGFIHNLARFLIGVRDSLYLGWIRKLIFCPDGRGGIHPASYQLRGSLKAAFLQVGIFMFVIPIIMKFLGLHVIAFLWRAFFLILSYGYIFFYNQQIIASTRQILLYRTKILNQPNFQLDINQKIDSLQYIGGVIKGIIFLVFYYVPIMIITTILSQIIPYFGMFSVIISQGFFNSAFFFLSTWPYDRFNAAFLQHQKYYLLGFGMFVSIICNYFLSGFISLGVCLIISLWMLINSVVYSPVQKVDGTQFNSFGQIWQILINTDTRNQLRNSYSLHRLRLRNQNDNPRYRNYGRDLILNAAFIVNPALRITQWVNIWIQRWLRRIRGQNPRN